MIQKIIPLTIILFIIFFGIGFWKFNQQGAGMIPVSSQIPKAPSPDSNYCGSDGDCQLGYFCPISKCDVPAGVVCQVAQSKCAKVSSGKKTYVNKNVADNKYSISFPQDWTLKNTPFSYSGKPVSGEFLTLSKNGYEIHIDRVPSGPGTCGYEDNNPSLPLGVPLAHYDNFVEFKLGTRTARRGKLELELTEDTYGICQPEQKSNIFTSVTDFGTIYYKAPVGQTKLLKEMDTIITTLKKV